MNFLQTKECRRPASHGYAVSRIVALPQTISGMVKTQINCNFKRENIIVSESTVGRILKEKG